MEKKSLSSKVVSLLAGLVYVIFGILMIQNPNTTLATISFVMGWTVAIIGVAAFIYAITYKGEPEFKKISFMEGFLLLLLGLMLLFGDFIHNTMILAYLLVFWIIMDSALQLQMTTLMPNSGAKWFVRILDILIIAYGIFMLFHPFEAERFFVFYLGFAFISTGVAKFVKSF